MSDLKYVMEAIQLKEDRQRLPVIRMEIDYELATLYEAMKESNKVQIIKSKERLNHLRLELLKLENKT